jgi:hypothetical protein
MSENNGGSAFPVAVGDDVLSWGMTLRDYFAAKAMQGMIGADAHKKSTDQQIAAYAYEMADAMLDERED